MQLNLFKDADCSNYNESDYVVTGSNRIAMELLLLGNWQVVILYGENGSGKSHLSNIWCHRNNGMFINGEHVMTLEKKCFVIEDIDRNYVGNEIELLHYYNYLIECGARLLMTSGLVPSALNFLVPDLRSRILATMSVGLLEPDDDTLRAVFLKQLADRQIRLDLKLIDYVLLRMERSFCGIRTLVRKIESIAYNSKITINSLSVLFESEGIVA